MLCGAPAEVNVLLLQVDSASQTTEQEGRTSDISEQSSVKGAEVSVAEQGSSEQACCELCEQGGHCKEDCPLVVAAQESDSTPEAEEADWQVVVGKASKTQAAGSKSNKAGNGNKTDKGSKEKGKEEKIGDATKVITVHRDGPNGWVMAKRPLGSGGGSGSSQPRST